MLRRLHPDQPDHFEFTAANQAWAEAQITKYPEGRQQSAIIPILWRAQEQEGWLSRTAIEHVAEMLGMPYIRALEVATFYFMFQLQPVGSVAHIQICGTTSCMICGSEDLIGVCREKIAPNPHDISEDGKFSWEEVECLGACANAPMAQIGKDYYENLTAKRLGEILDELASGKVPTPGPQDGSYGPEPKTGLTSLTDMSSGTYPLNASATLATEIGDGVKRIDGSEVPLLTPWLNKGAEKKKSPPKPAPAPKSAVQQAKETATKKATTSGKTKSKKTKIATAVKGGNAKASGTKPKTMTKPRKGGADDLKLIKGVGPKLELLLHKLGFFHFDQVAAWKSAEVDWVDQNLEGFKGRVSRDNWVAQAKVLATGGKTN